MGSKITADDDCNHEIKRYLLGRKVMTNLDGIFKSKDITLSTKVHLVKATVFPVVMSGCESWTVKKAEHRRIDSLTGEMETKGWVANQRAAPVTGGWTYFSSSMDF